MCYSVPTLMISLFHIPDNILHLYFPESYVLQKVTTESCTNRNMSAERFWIDMQFLGPTFNQFCVTIPSPTRVVYLIYSYFNKGCLSKSLNCKL